MSANEDVDMADVSASSVKEAQLADARKDAPVAPVYKVKSVRMDVRQKLGLSLDSKSQIVNYVRAGGQGEKLGINVGDQMMTLNGKPFGPTWEKWTKDDSLKPNDLVSGEIRYQTVTSKKQPVAREEEPVGDDDAELDGEQQEQAGEYEEAGEEEQLGDGQPPAEGRQPEPVARKFQLVFVSSRSSDSEDGIPAANYLEKRNLVDLRADKEAKMGESAKEHTKRPIADAAPKTMEEDEAASSDQQLSVDVYQSKQSESQQRNMPPTRASNEESDAVAKAKPRSQWSPSEQKIDLERRHYEDGFIAPASTPQELPDGTFRRPRGPSPKGTVWDQVRGLWAPRHESSQTSLAPKQTKGIEPAPSSMEESKAVSALDKKVKPRSQWSSSERKADMERRQREGGCIAPASAPQELEDGTFKRPSCPAPKGLVWDEVRGLWTAPTTARKPRRTQVEVSSGVPKPKARSELNSTDRNADLERRLKERSDGCLPPPSTPEKLPDGTFRCPYGVRPKGFSWDSIRGLWVPKAHLGGKDADQMVNLDSENESKRSANEKAISDNAKADEITVGTRVYCEWLDGSWYWGQVTRVYRKQYSRYNYYAIDYDDGDQQDDVPRKKLFTVSEAEQYGFFPPKAPGTIGSKRKASNGSHNGAASSSSKKPRTGGLSGEEKETSKNFPGYDPHTLFRKKCGHCQLCIKDDCGKCSSCLWNADNPSSPDPKCCLQKMCDRLPEAKKAQPSSHLPEGWTFVLSSDTTKEEQYAKDHPEVKPGLKILAFNGRRYRSLEAAANHNFRTFHNFASGNKLTVDGLCRVFYEELGLGTGKRSKKVASTGGVLNPRKLKSFSCGTCGMCTRKNCGKCAPCRRNHSIGRRRECCFQKMCISISDEQKAQPMTNLPDGWKFIFDNTFQQDTRQKAKSPDVKPGLRILAPNGVRYRSLEAAMNHNHKMTEALQDGLGITREKLCRDFYELVGIDSRKPSSEANRSASSAASKSPELKDLLLGKPICQQWIGADGCTKVVYGQVTEYHPAKKAEKNGEEDEEEMFTIEYNGASTMQHDFNLPLPASRKWDSRGTLGAVLSYETKAKRDVLDHKPTGEPRCIWMVPDMRQERLSDSPDGRQRLPRLTMEFRGYMLELNVKESTIADAGLGVFVKCVPLDSSQHGTPLVFQPGEFLDLGVYAPHRPEDRKLRSLFLVKNFVCEEECVVWVFDSLDSDYHLDITDDHEGKLHDVAKLHVPVYVNESNEGTHTVCAEHDPSGAVHYLLGCSSSQLVIPSDGTEEEVFIWYGARYEPVRIKQGYSKLPPDEQEKVLKEYVQGSDEDFVHAVLQFKWKDLVACSLHLLDVFTWKPDHKYMTQKVKRALLAAVLLQRRARQLFEAESSNHPDSQVKKARQTIFKLVKRLLAPTVGADNSKREEWRTLFAQCDYEELEEEVLQDGGLWRAVEEGPTSDDEGESSC